MILVFLLILIPMQVNVAASKVFQEGSAGGFHYKIMVEDRSIFWEVGHKEHKTMKFKQTNENKNTLESYREAVNKARGHRFAMILYAGYFVFVCLATLIFYKKRKHIPVSVGIIIGCLAVWGLYSGVTNYIDMQAALQDAGYYYGTLLVE